MSVWLEIAANVVATVSILLAGRNSVHTWWTGILGCALFVVVFGQARLYADVVLQVFFIMTSAMGWWRWLRGDRGGPLLIGNAKPVLLSIAIVVGATCAWVYGAILRAYTDAYAPFPDSAVLVFSVIAQILLMQRKLESWWFWLLVNSIAVPLYLSRGLHLTALLYSAYWLNALVSWRRWRHLIKALNHPAQLITA